MNDDNSKCVFIPFIYVYEPLNLITQVYNRSLSSAQKEELTLGVERMSWECKEFLSWKVRELPVVKASPTPGKVVCLTKDLFVDKTSLRVSQQIHQSSKILLAKCKRRARLELAQTLLAETTQSFLRPWDRSHPPKTPLNSKFLPFSFLQFLYPLRSVERKRPDFHFVCFMVNRKWICSSFCVAENQIR